MRVKLSELAGETYDFVVVGAGINGAASAASLSAAGLKVLIVDAGDYASFTSQESSNMVWGGIKYLQSLEIPLVFKLSRSRARLMRNYQNRIRQIGFLAAIGPNAPANLIAVWAGSILYWFIGLFSTKAPKVFDRAAATRYEPGLTGQQIGGAVQYFDGLLLDNDARFVWDFVAKAKSFGATARNYTRVTSANRTDSAWRLTLRDEHTGESVEVSSKSVVNAAGPFAPGVNQLLQADAGARLVLSKGIHLIVPRLTDDDRVLAFWDEEGRLFYVLPMHDRSVIGTTDTRVDEPETRVTDEDRAFVLRQINKSLSLPKPLTVDDIIAERSGVRPLVARSSRQQRNSDQVDWHKMSRKHVVATDAAKSVIAIYGGKLTDCLNLGDEVRAEAARLGHRLAHHKWYGEGKQGGSAAIVAAVRAKVGDAGWAKQIALGLYRRHGAAALEVIKAAPAAELEPLFEGLDFTPAELTHLIATEDVVTATDLLRRRTPIALLRTADAIAGNARLQTLLAKVSAR